ncbi:MAG: DNA repair protein RadA [Nitrococcus sp.]|nr:DNA repair protein RadA [Nitrococcus sp.]
MHSKAHTVFICHDCGARAAKWSGQCPECGAWNSLAQTTPSKPSTRPFGHYAGECGVKPLAEVARTDEMRFATGSAELDRVLGGGLVQGSVVLLGGDPGIGKSTLLLETMARLSGNAPALYVTGEESLRQVALRAKRLGVRGEGLQVLAETALEAILATAEEQRPAVMVVDSVQTLHGAALGSAPGSVAQVRDCAAHLVRFAKQTGTAVFLVGHVTKEGQLAGPRVLEHMVDTVLYFESDSASRFRLLRAVKNRFGAVNELGVFAMTDSGLREVKNPSAIFLTRHGVPVAGSGIMVTREGTRPLLVEVQALVAGSPLTHPRRVTVGLDGTRLAMLLAVLHRHGGICTSTDDVFVNVVGGVRVSETASDLPVLMAVLSSLRDRPIAQDWVMFGELGLAGEIRPVPNGEERLQEAAKHGFKRALVPANNKPRRGRSPSGLGIVAVERLDQAVNTLF